MSNTTLPHDEGRIPDSHPLVAELAKVLPKDRKFLTYHLSTPPLPTDPLCHPPAYSSGSSTATESKEKRPSKPLKTYCEKHFLAISIDSGKEDPTSNNQVLVLALEIYVYTTSFSTIIFVSKADSTGYLNLLNLPKGTPSPIREVTACFVAFLVANRRRPTKQLVVNLFARSQSQYLFPGSVKNPSKHVLDDRGLVRWWCRVLNSLLESDGQSDVKKLWDSIHGYLIIPGLDNYETRAFLPRTSAAAANWTLGHPLENMSPYTSDPSTFGSSIHPRSLIPTYPDDPKARFVEELEESAPEKAKLLKGWGSPKTLDQFWEMMAFRQECSSGRMTGFVWVVFEPSVAPKPSASTIASATSIPTPNVSFSATLPITPKRRREDASLLSSAGASSKPAKRTKKLQLKHKSKKVLTGPIIPRKPRVKAHKKEYPKLVETSHFYWPENGRGQVVLDETGYKRAIEYLLYLEFGTLEQAIASTARWNKEVNMGESWTLEVVGERETAVLATSSSSGGETVNNLSGAIRRKRSSDDRVADDATSSAPTANALDNGLIRKKAKLDSSDTADADAEKVDQTQLAEPQVNVLSTGMIRKKPKTS
ncbi:hypothetical protein M426DRAFT_324972 [Hypoxylon sp. CI-4A]|nr:hypothetical protein M426DRAFT_324972 [Hypoxylon sp. CI-4A]